MSLVFSCSGLPLQASVQLGGIAGALILSASGTGTSPATISIGKAINANFTVSCNTKTYTGTLEVGRPPVLGTGIFTLPVLPLAIVYAPPQSANSTMRNTNAFTTAVNQGVAYSTTLTDTVGAKLALTSGNCADPIMEAQNVANLVKNIPEEDLKEIGTVSSAALTVLGQLFGSAAYTQVSGISIGNNNTLNVSDTKSQQVTAGLGGGPGLDDAFVYLYNIKLVWVARTNIVELVMLSYDTGQKKWEVSAPIQGQPGCN